VIGAALIHQKKIRKEFNMTFKDYKLPGTCDVCGKETDVVVCASTMGAISFAYCEDCFNKQLEPYWAMVSYISCAGKFPNDINEDYQELCRNILKGLGKTEEQFIKDVDNAIQEMHDYFESL
jgi:transcription elongation factor Elf1